MAFTYYPATNKIWIPQSDLTLISGTIYEMDTDEFRLALKTWEASRDGIVFLKTHNHNTQAIVAGVTYARAVVILDPYIIEFEDGQYTVILKGSNNNIFDVENGILVQNQVQVIPTNSAGLIVVTQGSGVTEQDKTDIINGVWDELLGSHLDTGSIGKAIDDILNASGGLTQEQQTQLQELYILAGLKLGIPMTVTRTSRVAGSIELKISGDGENETTVERQ